MSRLSASEKGDSNFLKNHFGRFEVYEGTLMPFCQAIILLPG